MLINRQTAQILLLIKDWVVTGGLKAGERVIIDNLIKLRPGAPVAPHAPGEAAPAGQAASAQPKT